MVHCPLLELALHPVSVDDDRVDEDREDVDSDEDDDLDQVADKPDGVSASNTVSFWDMTTARPHTDFVPRNDCGDLLETKMVDFCLALSDSEVKSRALRTLKEYAVPRTKTYGSINHTEYAPLTLRPMSVSIESKTPEGSSDRALSQLSLWVACHFERLRSLRALKREREGLPLALEGYIPIALPLLMAMGPQWRLYFAVDTEDSIVSLHIASLVLSLCRIISLTCRIGHRRYYHAWRYGSASWVLPSCRRIARAGFMDGDDVPSLDVGECVAGLKCMGGFGLE